MHKLVGDLADHGYNITTETVVSKSIKKNYFQDCIERCYTIANATQIFCTIFLGIFSS